MLSSLFWKGNAKTTLGLCRDDQGAKLLVTVGIFGELCFAGHENVGFDEVDGCVKWREGGKNISGMNQGSMSEAGYEEKEKNVTRESKEGVLRAVRSGRFKGAVRLDACSDLVSTWSAQRRLLSLHRRTCPPVCLVMNEHGRHQDETPTESI